MHLIQQHLQGSSYRILLQKVQPLASSLFPTALLWSKKTISPSWRPSPLAVAVCSVAFICETHWQAYDWYKLEKRRVVQLIHECLQIAYLATFVDATFKSLWKRSWKPLLPFALHIPSVVTALIASYPPIQNLRQLNRQSLPEVENISATYREKIQEIQNNLESNGQVRCKIPRQALHPLLRGVTSHKQKIFMLDPHDIYCDPSQFRAQLKCIAQYLATEPSPLWVIEMDSTTSTPPNEHLRKTLTYTWRQSIFEKYNVRVLVINYVEKESEKPSLENYRVTSTQSSIYTNQVQKALLESRSSQRTPFLYSSCRAVLGELLVSIAHCHPGNTYALPLATYHKHEQEIKKGINCNKHIYIIKLYSIYSNSQRAYLDAIEDLPPGVIILAPAEVHNFLCNTNPLIPQQVIFNPFAQICSAVECYSHDEKELFIRNIGQQLENRFLNITPDQLRSKILDAVPSADLDKQIEIGEIVLQDAEESGGDADATIDQALQVFQECENSMLKGPLPPFLTEWTKGYTESHSGQEICVGREQQIQDISIYLNSAAGANNVILVGEAGSGKTQLIRYIAQQIDKNCIPSLQGYRVFNISISAIMAGTQYRGDLEERMRNIITYLTKIPKKILFIDEIHQITGAGKTTNTHSDVAHMLKEHITQSGLKVVGATTPEEYVILESDKAFLDRFQKMSLAPLSKETKLQALRAKCESFKVASNAETDIPDETLQSILHAHTHSLRPAIAVIGNIYSCLSARRDITLEQATNWALRKEALPLAENQYLIQEEKQRSPY